jgi:hypothetical protein
MHPNVREVTPSPRGPTQQPQQPLPSRPYTVRQVPMSPTGEESAPQQPQRQQQPSPPPPPSPPVVQPITEPQQDLLAARRYLTWTAFTYFDYLC